MKETTYEADWRVVYPAVEDQVETFRALKRQLMCNWSWDLFIWDLKELRRLLTKCPAEYNYLYVTRVLSARATYLVLNGPFAGQQADIVRGVSDRNIQYAAIYRHLFMQELDRAKVMRKAADDGDPQDERFFQIAVTAMEENFRKLLQILACSDDMELEFLGQKVGAWIKAVIVDKDGVDVDLLPSPISVPVRIDEMRAYRKIQPAKAELVKKVVRQEPVFTMRERHGRETACDLELERLCRWNLVKGMPALKYGEDRFQYYATMTNESKDTLYLVCVDRTLRMKKCGNSMPGSMPKAIHTGWVGGRGDVYEVTFDNGVRDLFELSLRAHKEIEKRHIPPSVTRQVNKRGLDMWASEAKPPCLTAVVQEPAVLCTLVKDSVPTETKAATPDKVTIHGDFKVIEVGSKRIDLATKPKRRAFLRFLHEEKKRTGVSDFYFDEMRERFSMVTGKPLKSDRFADDLFKGQAKEFSLLFEELDRAAGRYRLLI